MDHQLNELINISLTMLDVENICSTTDSTNKSATDFLFGTHTSKLMAIQRHLMNMVRSNRNGTPLLEVGTSSSGTYSALQMLEFWRDSFWATIQQYHRLTTNLIRPKDIGAVRNVWRQNLTDILEYYNSNDISCDTAALKLDDQVCQIHANLLMDASHQILGSDDLLPNDVVSLINQRQDEIQKRLTVWKVYHVDQMAICDWFDAVEKCRVRCHLQCIPVNQLPIIVQRLETLSARIPEGEDLLVRLDAHQQHLQEFCDEILFEVVQIECAAYTQRVANLKDGLQTWLQFLQWLQTTLCQFNERLNRLRRFYDTTQSILMDWQNTKYCTDEAVTATLDSLRKLQTDLTIQVETEFSQLRGDELHCAGALSVLDVTSHHQQVMVLSNQFDDLSQNVEQFYREMQQTHNLQREFHTKQQQFSRWWYEFLPKLTGLMTAQDINAALQTLKSDLKLEMNKKECDYQWLHKTGATLLCTDNNDGAVTRDQLDLINSQWTYMMDEYHTVLNKLVDAVHTLNKLEGFIGDYYNWLQTIELKLAQPIKFQSLRPVVLERILGIHTELRQQLEKSCTYLKEIENLMLTVPNNQWESLTQLQQRWKRAYEVCRQRTVIIETVWKSLQNGACIINQKMKWLCKLRRNLSDLEKRVNSCPDTDVTDVMNTLDGLHQDVQLFEVYFTCLREIRTDLLNCDTSVMDRNNLLNLSKSFVLTADEFDALKSQIEMWCKYGRTAIDKYNNFKRCYVKHHAKLTRIDAALPELQWNCNGVDDENARNAQIKQLQDELEAIRNSLNCLEADDFDLSDKVDKRRRKSMTEMLEELRNFVFDINAKLDCLNSINVRRFLDMIRQCYKNVTALSQMMSTIQRRNNDEAITSFNLTECNEVTQKCDDLLAVCQSELNNIHELHRASPNECTLIHDLDAKIRELTELNAQKKRYIRLQKMQSRLENDLWRIQTWLETAEALQAAQNRKTIPKDIEILQDVIQDQWKFTQTLNSHVNVLETLLTADDYNDYSQLDKDRLDSLKIRLQRIVVRANHIEGVLRMALQNNKGFHCIIKDLKVWMRKATVSVQRLDLQVVDDMSVVNKRIDRLVKMRQDLDVNESIVIRLSDSANQVNTDSTTIGNELDELRQQYHSLCIVVELHLTKLKHVLKRQGVRFRSDPSAAVTRREANHNTDDQCSGSALQKSCRYLGRVAKASLPFQGLFLLLLGLAALVPHSETDYTTCSYLPTMLNRLHRALRWEQHREPAI